MKIFMAKIDSIRGCLETLAKAGCELHFVRESNGNIYGEERGKIKVVMDGNRVIITPMNENILIIRYASHSADITSLISGTR